MGENEIFEIEKKIQIQKIKSTASKSSNKVIIDNGLLKNCVNKFKVPEKERPLTRIYHHEHTMIPKCDRCKENSFMEGIMAVPPSLTTLISIQFITAPNAIVHLQVRCLHEFVSKCIRCRSN